MDNNNLVELYTAFALAQGEIHAAVFDRSNPMYKNRYATLNSIREAIQEPFAKHGLSVWQDVKYDERTQMVSCKTSVFHKAGGSLVSESLSLPVTVIVSNEDKARGVVGIPTAQAVGSAISYARRYQLSSVLNVTAEEDDDGNAASGVHAPPVAQAVKPPPPPPPPAPPKPQAPPPPAPVAKPAEPAPTPKATEPTQAQSNLQIAQAQWKEKWNLLEANNLGDKKADYFAKKDDTVEQLAAKVIAMNRILAANGISS